MISVIIPTYRPQEYLWECLDSLSAQTFSKEAFEIIVVLNGEKDPYYTEILSHLPSNATLLYSEQAGVSNARNIGLTNARGEFVAFIDDDDYVSPAYLEQLSQHADEQTIAISNAIAFNESGPRLPYAIEQEYFKCAPDGKQPFFRPKKFFSGPCMKLIHRDIIGLRRFDTKFTNGEDSLFMFLISDRIRYADFTDKEAVYYRRMRARSATQSTTRCYRIKNNLKLMNEYTRIYFSNACYSTRFYISRLIAGLHAIISR